MRRWSPTRTKSRKASSSWTRRRRRSTTRGACRRRARRTLRGARWREARHGARGVDASREGADGLPAPDVRPGFVAFVRKRLYLGCADGALELGQVQPDGKQPMDARAFAAGLQNVKSGNLEWGACMAEEKHRPRARAPTAATRRVRMRDQARRAMVASAVAASTDSVGRGLRVAAGLRGARRVNRRRARHGVSRCRWAPSCASARRSRTTSSKRS